MIEAIEELMRMVAAEAILPFYGRLAKTDIQEKSPGEWVTVADKLAEQRLTSGLRDLLPQSVVIGEEAAAADPSLLSKLANEEWVWIVDPLDGTTNFVEGRGPIAIMAALMRNGATIAACLLDPLKGVAATAEVGGGAFLDGKRVFAPSGAVQTKSMCGAVLTRFLPADLRARIEGSIDAFAEVLPGSGCAGFEYSAIVRGEQHFVLFWRTLPWDHLPGALFLHEAGAEVRRLDGSSFVAGDYRAGLLAAQNVEVWETTRAALFKGEPSRAHNCDVPQ